VWLLHVENCSILISSDLVYTLHVAILLKVLCDVAAQE